MLGFGLTLMGGLLAQDAADWGQTVMYFPSGNLNADPGGDEAASAANVSARYATKLWEADDANDDDSILVHTLSHYRGQRYCFIFGWNSDIQYYRYSVNFSAATEGTISHFLNASSGKGSMTDTVPLYGQTSLVFRCEGFRKIQTYAAEGLLSEKTDTALPHYTARLKTAKIGQAASTFGGAYYHNRTAGREQERCVLAMSSADAGADYRGAIYYVQGKELTEL